MSSSHQYAASTRAVSATRSTLNVVIVLVALLLNWLLLLSGPTRALGLYAVFIYLLLLYAFDLALEQMVRSGVGCMTSGVRLDPASHIHYSPLNNSVATYIAVWLVWWLAAHLFFEAGLVFTHDWWRSLLLLSSLVSSLGSSADDYSLQCFSIPASLDGPSGIGSAMCGLDMRRIALSLAPDLFCLLFLFALALPSQVWLPQTTTPIVGVLRVGAYFLGVLIADFFLSTAHMTEQQAHKADECVRAMSTIAEHEQPKLMSSTFCAIVLEYDRVRGANRRRARRVVASSAWVLVVAPITAVLFGIVLVIAQAVAAAIRSSNARRSSGTPLDSVIVTSPLNLNPNDPQQQYARVELEQQQQQKPSIITTTIMPPSPQQYHQQQPMVVHHQQIVQQHQARHVAPTIIVNSLAPPLSSQVPTQHQQPSTGSLAPPVSHQQQPPPPVTPRVLPAGFKNVKW